MYEKYVLSFSGGRTSAYMTIELLKQEKYKNSVVLFANTGKEDEGTLRFVNDVDNFIGNKIIWVEYCPEKNYKVVNFKSASRNGQPFEALIKKRKYVPNVVTRYCTQELKIRVMKKYCKEELKWKHWTNLVGIRYDEPQRWNKSKSVERKEVFDIEHPLVKMKVTKQIILDYWKNMLFDLNINEHEGNCDLCFLKGKKKKQAILRVHPERFQWWIEMEKLTGTTFVKDYSYYDLVRWLNIQPEFNFDDSIDCFCNID